MFELYGGVSLAAIITRIMTGFIKVGEDYLQLMKAYPIQIDDVLPEPQEMTGFVLFWMLYAVIFLVLFYLFDRYKMKCRVEVVYMTGTVLAAVGACVLLLAEEDRFYINMSWFMNWEMGLVIVMAGLSALHLSHKIETTVIFDALSVLLACVSCVFCYVRNPLFGTNAFHFNGYFTTIYNVYHGAVLGVDSNIIYGTYGYLLYPVYKLIGLSLESYAVTTMIMCLMVLLCEWHTIRNLIDNPVIRFLAFSGCVYINVFFAVNAHYEQFITQHFPMRVFFPMIMVAYITSALKRQNILNKKSFYGGFLICYFAFMMNLESAVTTCLSWASACFFHHMMTGHKQGTSIGIRRHIWFVMGLIVGITSAFAAWVATIEIIAYIKAGGFIAISELYSTQVVFAKIGYGMLPLPNYVHVYMFVFLVYALFLGIAFKQLFWGIMLSDDVKSQITFALSVTGIFMLIYYMGRTHNRSLFAWLSPCFILLAYLFENTSRLVRSGISRCDRVLALIASGIIFVVVSVYGTSTIYLLKNSDMYQDFINRQIENNFDEIFSDEIELLHKHAKDGSVNYLGNYAAGIAMTADVHNNFLGEMAIDWLSWDDYRYIEDFLRECDGAIIIDGTASEHISAYIPDSFNQIINEKEFEIIDSSDLSVVYGYAGRKEEKGESRITSPSGGS